MVSKVLKVLVVQKTHRYQVLRVRKAVRDSKVLVDLDHKDSKVHQE